MTIRKIILAFLLLSLSRAAFADVDVEKVLTDVDRVLRGNSHDMTVMMDVKTKSWQRHYKIRVMMKGVDYTFARVLSPPKVEGQGFLRIKTKLWNYLPSAERTILIPPSMMLDRFMGSDFSNDDFVRLSYLPRDYDCVLVGEEELNGFPVYHLDLTPKPDAPVTYGRLELWVRKEDSAPVRWFFYNVKKEHIRTITYSEFKDFNGHSAPSVWTMTNENDKDREAVVTIQEAVYDIPLADDVFTKEKLEQYP